MVGSTLVLLSKYRTIGVKKQQFQYIYVYKINAFVHL